jgi:hypothetical protein
MSAATWNQSDAQNNATRPGIYINFIGAAQSAVQVGAQGTVAIPVTADWGLLNGITDIEAEGSIPDAFGTGGNASLLISQALRGGASKVRAFRMGVAGSVAKATLVLNDVPVAPANTLTAKYEGARANAFTVKVAVNAVDATRKDVSIIEGGNTLEVFTVLDNTDLTNQIAGNVSGINPSKYVTCVTTGTANRALANQAGALMAGGNSGGSVTTTEYSAALTALEVYDWNLLVPGDTASTAIQATVRAYIVRLRDEGHKAIAVMGGQSVAGMSAAAFTTEFNTMVANAISTSTGNHEGVVQVFPGIVDELSNVSLSGAQSAARVAGMIAKNGFTGSITKEDTGAANVTYRMVNADIKKGLQNGLLMLTVDGDRAVVESGINTLTTYTTAKPRDFRKIRLIRANDAVAQTLDDSLSSFVLGETNNNAVGRNFVLNLMVEALDVFRQAGAIDAGFTVGPDVARNLAADPDEFFAEVSYTPIDSIEKIFISCKVL